MADGRTNVFPLSGYQDALDTIASRQTLKVAVKP